MSDLIQLVRKASITRSIFLKQKIYEMKDVVLLQLQSNFNHVSIIHSEFKMLLRTVKWNTVLLTVLW